MSPLLIFAIYLYCAVVWNCNIFVYLDINECSADPGPCDTNAACANSPDGSFTCTCNSGYTGDGISCTGERHCFICRGQTTKILDGLRRESYLLMLNCDDYGFVVGF